MHTEKEMEEQLKEEQRRWDEETMYILGVLSRNPASQSIMSSMYRKQFGPRPAFPVSAVIHATTRCINHLMDMKDAGLIDCNVRYSKKGNRVILRSWRITQKGKEYAQAKTEQPKAGTSSIGCENEGDVTGSME